MDSRINTTPSVENPNIAITTNKNHDQIANRLIQLLKDQQITNISEQKSILTRACAKLSEQPIELITLKIPQNERSLSPENRKFLQKNIIKITDAFKKNESYFVSLLESCVKEGIFSNNDKEIIQSKPVNQQKYIEFLRILPRKGNKAEAVITELQNKEIISLI